jgi:hypothetical protein
MLPRRGYAAVAAMPLLAIVLGAGCSPLGGGSPAVPASPRTIALQPDDLQTSLQRCSESGDVESFLAQARQKSPDSYRQIDEEWRKLKDEGAQQGQVEVYTDTPNQCTELLRAIGGTARVVFNLVVAFRDHEAALKAYRNGLLGFTPGSTTGQGVTTGTGTGLTVDSTAYTEDLGGQVLYLAAWANQLYDIFLFAINIPAADSRRATTRINGRVH